MQPGTQDRCTWLAGARTVSVCTGMNHWAASDLCERTAYDSRDVVGFVHYTTISVVNGISLVDVSNCKAEGLAWQHAIRASLETYVHQFRNRYYPANAIRRCELHSTGSLYNAQQTQDIPRIAMR